MYGLRQHDGRQSARCGNRSVGTVASATLDVVVIRIGFGARGLGSGRPRTFR